MLKNLGAWMLALVLGFSGASVAKAAEGTTTSWTEWYQLDCGNDGLIEDSIGVACTHEGEEVTLRADCSNGIFFYVYKCGPSPIEKPVPSPIEKAITSDVFGMGARFQAGALYVPRTSSIGEGVGIVGTGSFVFQFPQTFSKDVRLELSLGTGATFYPSIGDTLSTNIFELGVLVQATETLDLTVGYRFVATGDLDENLSHIHQAFVRLAWEVAEGIYLGPTIYGGGSVWARSKIVTEEDEMSILTKKVTTHHEAFAPTVTVDLFWRFF